MSKLSTFKNMFVFVFEIIAIIFSVKPNQLKHLKKQLTETPEAEVLQKVVVRCADVKTGINWIKKCGGWKGGWNMHLDLSNHLRMFQLQLQLNILRMPFRFDAF